MTSDRSGSDWTIRGGQLHELPALAELERRAGARFESIPALAELPEVLAPPEALAAAIARGQLWVAAAVADGSPVGFAYADVIDGAVHLEELDVLPEWGRHGIGRTLVETVVDDARRRGLTAVTLTTFRDVPWNAPYYARLGFTTVDLGELGPGLRALWDEFEERATPEAKFAHACDRFQPMLHCYFEHCDENIARHSLLIDLAFATSRREETRQLPDVRVARDVAKRHNMREYFRHQMRSRCRNEARASDDFVAIGPQEIFCVARVELVDLASVRPFQVRPTAPLHVKVVADTVLLFD